MVIKKIVLAAFATSMLAGAADAASLVTFGNPWGQKASTLDVEMDTAFGQNGWADVVAPTDTTFLTGEDFVFIEGGDSTTDELEAFLTSNGADLLAWVNNGGNLFINAAPNEGNGFSFGGFTLNYPGGSCSSGCVASDPAHEIFDDIAANDFTGSSFSHATVSGGTALIERSSDGAAILAEANIGNGFLLFGGMTTTNFHSFGQGAELRVNLLEYTAAGGNPSPVPLPAAGWMLIAGLGGLRLMRRKDV